MLVDHMGQPIDVRRPPRGVLVYPGRYRYRRRKRASGASSNVYIYRAWWVGSDHRECYLGIATEIRGAYDLPADVVQVDEG